MANNNQISWHEIKKKIFERKNSHIPLFSHGTAISLAGRDPVTRD